MYAGYGVLALLGAALFLAGQGMVGNETTYEDQVPGINLAIVGVVLANAAGGLLLLAGRRSVTGRRVAVLGAVPALRKKGVIVGSAANSGLLVGGDGRAHFHREDCAMAAGRAWPALDRAAHENDGRRPCGVCRP